MLLRHASHYMMASATTAILGFVGAAIYTRLLTPADYGVYVVGFSLASFIFSVAFAWVQYSVMRFESEGARADVRMTSLAAYGLSALAAPFLLIGAHYGAHMPWGRATLSIGLALAWGMFDLGQEIQRSRFQVRGFVFGSMFRAAAALGLCVAIAWSGGGGLGQLAGAALAYGLAALVSAPRIWQGPRAPFDPAKLKLFFRLGVAVTVAGLIVTLQAALDRLFIAWRFGDGPAGLYGASADVVKQIVLIPAGSVAAAAFPLTVRAFASGDAAATRRQLAHTAELLLAILVPAAVGLALTAPYLVSFLFGPAFRETAGAIMPVLAFAWMFQSISQSYLHVSFHLAMKQGLSIPHGLATLAFNAALLWPMTSAFGPNGAAGSLLASEALGAAVGYALTLRAHRLPMIPGPAARIVAAAAVMALVVLALRAQMPAYSAGAFIALAASGALVYGLVAVALDVLGARAVVVGLLRRAQTRRAPRAL